MSNRHISRQVVMQTMYELDTNNAFNIPQEDLKVMLERNIEEFATEKLDKSFAVELLKETVSRLSVIDEVLTKSAPEWPIEKISIVDRNIIRVGLCELIFGQEKVPPKVAIDEAIELAKEYGGDSSSKFINGVLGAVYKELGEPDKDSHTKVKVSEKKSGCLIYAMDENNNLNLLFVHDVFGRWTLPKSDMLDNVSLNLVKEVKKNIDLDIKIIDDICNVEYIAHNPAKGRVYKDVHYYLASSNFVPVSFSEAIKGLDDVKWWKEEDLNSMTTYEDLKEVFSKGLEKIKIIINNG